MGFAEDMARIDRTVRYRYNTLRRAAANHAFQSIVMGSPVTGAPGQPVDEEKLRPSYTIQETTAGFVISSPLPYAEIIENNRRGAQLRSKVGGFHSIKMTRIGFKRIVRHELKRLRYNRGLGEMLTASTPRVRGPGGRFTGQNEPTLIIR